MKFLAILLLVLVVASTVYADSCVEAPSDIQLCQVSGYLTSKSANSQADLALASSLAYFNSLFNSDPSGDQRVSAQCLRVYADWYCSHFYPEVVCSQDLQIATPKKTCRSTCHSLNNVCRPNQLAVLGKGLGLANPFPDCESVEWGRAGDENGCSSVKAEINLAIIDAIGKNAYNGLAR